MTVSNLKEINLVGPSGYFPISLFAFPVKRLETTVDIGCLQFPAFIRASALYASHLLDVPVRMSAAYVIAVYKPEADTVSLELLSKGHN